MRLSNYEIGRELGIRNRQADVVVRMKTLRWIFGTAVLGLTLFVMVNWLHDSESANAATLEQAALGDEATLQVNLAILKHVYDQQQLEIDRLQLEQPRREAKAAPSLGADTTAAKLDEQRAIVLLQSDEKMVQLDKLHDPEDDSRVKASRQRAAAAEANRAVYARGVARDERIACYVGVLWLSLGFIGVLKKR